MLQEIPELGILGASSYALNEGGSITDGMNLLAGEHFSQLVNLQH